MAKCRNCSEEGVTLHTVELESGAKIALFCEECWPKILPQKRWEAYLTIGAAAMITFTAKDEVKIRETF